MNQEQTVFIVDDEPTVARSLERLLRAAGYMTLVFGSARQFMDYYKPGYGGCVLADFSMPDISGLDLWQQIACSGHLIPIVFVTGRDDLADLARAARSEGALDILTKPVKAELLLATVEKALAREREARRVVH